MLVRYIFVVVLLINAIFWGLPHRAHCKLATLFGAPCIKQWIRRSIGGACLVAAIAVFASTIKSKRENLNAAATIATEITPGQYRVNTITLPFGAVFSVDGRHLFVAGDKSLCIYVMNGGRPSLIKTYQISKAGGISVSPDGKYLAVSHPGDEKKRTFSGVTLHDIRTLVKPRGGLGLVAKRTTNKDPNDPTWTQTIQVGFSRDGRWLCACDETRDRVSVLDVARLVANDMTGAYRGVFEKNFIHPTGLEFSDDNGVQRVVFGSQNERVRSKQCSNGFNMGTVTVANLDSMTIENITPVGCTLSRISMRGDTVYANLRDENAVAVLRNGRVVTKIPVGIKPVGIKHAAGGKVIVVACSNRPPSKAPKNYVKSPGDIRIIDAATNTPIATLSALLFPRDVAISPDGNTAVVTEYFSDAFQVLDINKILENFKTV